MTINSILVSLNGIKCVEKLTIIQCYTDSHCSFTVNADKKNCTFFFVFKKNVGFFETVSKKGRVVKFSFKLSKILHKLFICFFFVEPILLCEVGEKYSVMVMVLDKEVHTGIHHIKH